MTQAPPKAALLTRLARLLCCVSLSFAIPSWSGCDDPSLVLVRIDASRATLSQLDTLEITITASRTSTGDALCEPSTRTFVLDAVSPDRVELPLSIAVLPGQRYDRILYVRVVGRFLGSIRIKTERIASLKGGEVTLRIPLTSDCLYRGIGRTEHCVDGVVSESPLFPILDEGRFVEEGTPCLVD